jgi:hypothetical protein
MEKQLFTPENVALLLRAADELNQARVFEGQTQKPFQVQKVVIDLSTARLPTQPYKISVPFKSLYVQDATDIYSTIDVQVGTQDSLQSVFSIKKNDSWNSDYPISECYLSWAAQSGKSITLILFTNAAFNSGSQISVTGGGVSISEGSSFTQSALTFVGATALSIFASDSTRKIGVFQNKTGASVWVGNSTVTNTNAFFEVAAGADFVWRNTGQLYGYSVAGGSGHKTEEF